MIPAELDTVIHAPKRLAAMSILTATETVSFAYLRERLDVTDSDLSKQMSVLQHAGYVTSKRRGSGRNKANWYRITRAGRDAFEAHVASLRALIDMEAERTDAPGGSTP